MRRAQHDLRRAECEKSEQHPPIPNLRGGAVDPSLCLRHHVSRDISVRGIAAAGSRTKGPGPC